MNKDCTNTSVNLRDFSVWRADKQVIKSIDLSLTDGVAALVGANGSGKSTLIQSLATVLPFVASSAQIAGHDIRSAQGQDRARRITGYLPQSPTSFSNLTVEQGATYCAWLKAVPRHSRRSRVVLTLEQLDLAQYRNSQLSTLSGGIRRLAHLAFALVHDPELLLLDEPTAGLDLEHQATVRRLMREVSKDRLVLFSTHIAEDMTEADVSTIAILRSGALAFVGSPDDLIRSSKSDIAADSEVGAALRRFGAQ